MIPTQYSKPINKIGSHLAVKENAMIPLKCLGFSMLTMAFLCLFFIRGTMPYIWFYTLGFLVMKYDLGKYFLMSAKIGRERYLDDNRLPLAALCKRIDSASSNGYY